MRRPRRSGRYYPWMPRARSPWRHASGRNRGDRELPYRQRDWKARCSLADVAILGKECLHRFAFRQHIDDALCALEGGKHRLFVEIDGKIDAAEGDAVVGR